MSVDHTYAAVVLAGGDGTRLRGLIRAMAGDDRPDRVLLLGMQTRPERLAVLPVSGVEWNDLGTPARVAASRARLDWSLATA